MQAKNNHASDFLNGDREKCNMIALKSDFDLDRGDWPHPKKITMITIGCTFLGRL